LGFLINLALLLSWSCQKQEIPRFKGKYFGQSIPDLSPKSFVPDVFSTKGNYNFHLHSSLFFTGNGNEVYFTIQKIPVDPGYDQTIMVMKQNTGKWNEPEPVSFSGKYSDQIFYLSADGNRIYFTSTRPLKGGGEALETRNGWIVQREDSSWSEPRFIATPMDLTVNDGTLYVSALFPGGMGMNDIYSLKYEDNSYGLPENLGSPVNTEFDDYICCIPNDETFLVKYQYNPTQKSRTGLYVSFKEKAGSWSQPLQFPDTWNLLFGFNATLSPDEKVLFILNRSDGIYWVETKAIHNIKNKQDRKETGLWTKKTPFDWTHDGDPLITPHFIIYSDKASWQEREKLSRGLEIFLKELTDFLEINPDSASWYPNELRRIVVYLNKTHPEVKGGYAFHGGMILISPDSKFFYNPHPGQYGQTVKHELTHVIDLAVTTEFAIQPPHWFREGFAMVCSGPRYNDIQSSHQLLQLISELGHDPNKWTPLSIYRYQDFPEKILIERKEDLYYPLFELAVRYLTDEYNTGCHPGSVLEICEQMALLIPFEIAFQEKFRISMEEFDTNFYDLIKEWLDTEKF
jgi:hypothetical protein